MIRKYQDFQAGIMKKGKRCGLDFDNPELVEKSIEIKTEYEKISKKLNILNIANASTHRALGLKINKQKEIIQDYGEIKY